MKDYCRKQARDTQCTTTTLQTGTTSSCEAFDVCLPFGRSLHFDGVCMTVAGEPTIEDGEYGVIVVEDGCIVGAKANPVCEYTPTPCSPAASSCSSSGSDITLQTGVCNLVNFDASGRLGATLTVVAGDNVTVSGCGTASSPLVISAVTQTAERTYVTSEDTNAITVTGTGTSSNPYVIGLAASGVTAGTYGGFTVDSYGRITGYEEEEETLIIQGGNGISVLGQDGIYTITLESTGVDASTYTLGGYAVTLDLAGRVTAINQAIAIDEQTFDPNDYLITVNAYGSITALTENTSTVANFAAAHVSTTGYAEIEITTNRSGRLYVMWSGILYNAAAAEDIDTGWSLAAGVYMSATYSDGDETSGSFTQAVGKCECGCSAATITEWRAMSSKTVAPGTYTIQITPAAGSLSGMSVVEAHIMP